MSAGLLPPNSSTNQQKNLTDEDYVKFWNTMVSLCRNPEDCLFGNHPTLRELNLQTGVKAGQGVIATYLNMLNVATNYKLKLNEIQISMLSQMIYEKYFYLKETEVALFFYYFFKHPDSESFFGAIEMETVMAMLTKWVRRKRGAAIEQHDKLLDQQRKEDEKPYLLTWEEFCNKNGKDSSDSPISRILSGKCKVPKDTKESITESAQALIENRWGYDDDAMMNARRAFVCRYGYTPEDYLRKEEKYV